MDKLYQWAKYFSLRGDVVLLHSQSSEHPSSQISYLAALPLVCITARGNEITLTFADQKVRSKEHPWSALKKFRKQNRGWLFGFLGYDLKNHIEALSSQNTDKIEAPDMYFMVPGFLLKYDHQSQQQEVLAGKLPGQKEIEARMLEVQDNFRLGVLYSQTSRKRYLQKINTAKRRITEGDFYEINLTHQMSAPFSGTPVALYQKMSRIGPVPFGSYLKVGDIHVCSQSPERFLKKTGDTVFSQPIKGTSKRGATADEDQVLKTNLWSSEKERAENLMIVDLVRNDLSKIARKGTVSVPQLFDIQSFDTVHHMVSTIAAKCTIKDPVAILRACFPMGSMTGAPKIRVMKSIEELEDYRRGIYSGAIGYITPNGDFDFNVIIRTAIIKNGRLYYSVGGAITGDSDPHKEWEETQIKARALLNVLERLPNV